MKAIRDPFILLLGLTVLIATLMPIQGTSAVYFGHFTTAAIALLFFFHGAKLSRQAMWEGLRHWRLHALTLSITFIIFPLIGLLAKPVLVPLLGTSLYYGFLFLCCLPSTVQSSIAFTSIAKGNVAAAVCSASFSNLLGMLITPILVGMLILGKQHQAIDSDTALLKIVILLLLPFVLGQLLRSVVYPWMQRFPKWIKCFDQGSILMVVYGAFSSAVVGGLWHQVGAATLLHIVLFNIVLLAIVMIVTWLLAQRLGFDLADQKTIFFCGSKKTLASGVPMAQILFAGQPLGLIILPIMIFHQIQLMVCAIIASYWHKHADHSIGQ